MANDKAKIDKFYIDNLTNLLKLQTDLNKDIRSDIYGVNSHEVNIDSTEEKISSLVSNIKHNFGGDFIDCLNNLKSEFNINEKNTLRKFKEKLENDNNVSLFQSYLNMNDSQITKYEDLKLITSIMPQLRQAKTAIINSIMSPDDFTKQLALNMEVNGKTLSTSNKLKYDNINKILKKHKFTKLIKSVIDGTITYGKYYVAVLPYDKLFTELLKNKQKNFTLGSTLDKNNINTLKNNLKPLKESVESINTLAEDIFNVCNNAEICMDSSNLLSENVMLAELSKSKMFKNTNNTKESINPNEFIDIFTKQKEKEDINDGFLSDDKNKLNISGCKIKKLDPRRLIELKIDEDNCLGYLYIENIESERAIRDFRKFNFKDNLSINNREKTVDAIYKNIGDILWKKLDKKFIEVHADVKERLYDVLKFSDVNKNSKIKVTYLNTNEVVKFEINNGESVFEPALFFSRLYMMVLLSTITAKVIRSNDIRAYYVDVDADGGMNNMIYNAIDTLQSTNHSILSANHISKIISSFTAFDDLIIPRAAGEKNSIDFDIISGQNVDMNTDLLELLEQICVNSTGVPLALLQNSNEVDFARTYTMLNISFMKNILDKQIDINPSITELIVKILSCELVDDESDKSLINGLECYLQSPMNLLLSNITEQLNNAKDVAQNITDLVAGTSQDNQKAVDLLLLSIAKKFCPNIPFEEFEDIYKDILNKCKEEELSGDVAEEGENY